MSSRNILGIMLAGMVVGSALPGPARMAAKTPDTQVQVREDATRREIIVRVTGITIPAGLSYGHHPKEHRQAFVWPARGWLRGYRIDVLDAQGAALPREVFHHAGVANLDRRQLPYPQVERLVAVGRETRPVLLPESMGVPLQQGQQMLMYYALVNPGDQPLTNVTLQLTVAWTPHRADAPQSVFPLALDANPKATGGTRAFDLPPGLSATSAEFTLPVGGHLRAVGAHLHDYATEIRLEDVVDGRVLVRLQAERDSAGRLLSVDTTRFLLKRRGLRLRPNHPYRVVGVYDNPTGDVIRDGAMAFLAGPFIPDDVTQWPAIDPTNSDYQTDRAGILGLDGPHSHHRSHGTLLQPTHNLGK